MEKIYQIRPHHGMCVAFFRGNGYSPEFTAHMKEMIEIFRNDPKLQLVLHTDEICTACPNNEHGECLTNEKVLRYDNGILDACNLKENMVIGAREFFRIVEQDVIQTGLRKKICGDCAWNYICEALEDRI